VKKYYYFFKALVPRWLQISIRRKLIQRKRFLHRDIWPIDEAASKLPEDWKGNSLLQIRSSAE
jgi:hypothetical protein